MILLALAACSDHEARVEAMEKRQRNVEAQLSELEQMLEQITDFRRNQLADRLTTLGPIQEPCLREVLADWIRRADSHGNLKPEDNERIRAKLGACGDELRAEKGAP